MRRMCLTATACALACLFLSCRKDKSEPGVSGLEKIRERGYMTIATSPNRHPFEYIDDSGDIVGIEIELAAKVAEDMGLKLRYRTMGLDDALRSVASGESDLGVGGFVIMRDGVQAFLFSSPYSSGGLRMIVLPSSSFREVGDLPLARISVLADSASEEHCRRMGYQVIVCNTDSDALRALEDGRADVWVADSLTAEAMLASYGVNGQDMPVMLDQPLVREEYAFVASSGNEELVVEVNKSLRRLRDDGTIGRIFSKYGAEYSKARDYMM